MVTIGITRKADTDEYKVYWRENGRYNEARTYYTDDPEDAVFALIDIIERSREAGEDAEPSNARFTLDLISRYNPGYLIKETRKAIEQDED